MIYALSDIVPLRDVLKSFFIRNKGRSDDELSRPWSREHDAAILYNRSTISIKNICLLRKKTTNCARIRVLVPDYFCDSVIAPLKKINVDVVYYALDSELSLNKDEFLQLLSQQAIDIVIGVHYFGVENSDLCFLKKTLKGTRCWLIEDAAHVFFPSGNIGYNGDFVLYSPHKHLPISCGAFLIVKKSIKKKSTVDQVDAVSMLRLSRDKYSLADELLWLMKKILQKYFSFFRKKSYMTILPVNRGAQAQEIHCSVSSVSPFTRKRLGFYADRCAYIKNTMIDNAKWMRHYIRRLGYSELSITASNCSPYYLSIDAGGCGESEYHELVRSYIPFVKWPDLPQCVSRRFEKHKHAINYYNNHFYLKVPFVIDKRWLHDFFSKKVPLNYGAISLKLLGHCDQHRYDYYYNKTTSASLEQSWAYGEAKYKAQQWLPLRYIIKINQQPVAIVQILKKKIARGLVTVHRVNSGPVYLSESLPVEEKAKILKYLTRSVVNTGRLFLLKPSFFFIMPNFSKDSILFNLINSGNRVCFNEESSHTLHLSLDRSSEDIRSSIQAKWRNQLKKSENNSFNCQSTIDWDHIDWLLDKVEGNSRTKGFLFNKRLMKNTLICLGKENYVCYIADLDGKRIAGLIVVKHGLSCTYFVSWSSKESKSLYVHNFLLWRAILSMKKRGCVRFDLGGIDEKKAQTIAHFKRGLGADEHRNIGDFVDIYPSAIGFFLVKLLGVALRFRK